ncbi:hypothetical protein GCM10009754_05780 [Amycolatopsis minnesotensis]|uniref:AMP-dependent synthetase/ligase domain-containing protein n=1 Tax=Amycolatopsis minnesotensis TaxID=337894 RepID=A0ABP5BES8_9PSEU
MVIGSAKDKVFCAGANIRMLAASPHEWKVNFCRFTNETRNGFEDAGEHSGQTYLAAVNGTCAGGGYEIALACEKILLVDDNSSTVALPEVPLLGVLPGTGGLTRVVDKRHVRKDRAAVEWGLVDEIVPRRDFEATVRERALEAAQASARPADATGIDLPLLLLSGILGAIYAGAVPVPVSTMVTGVDFGVRAHPWSELSTADPIDAPYPSWEDTVALWLYTSGTTGKPKAVMHRHADVRAVVECYAERVLGTSAEDRFLSVPKLFFAYGLGNSAFFPLAAGATTILEPARPSPELIARRVREERPTLFFGVPTCYSALLASEIPDDSFSSVRQAVSAGEPLPSALCERFRHRFGVEVLDGIGATEALHIFQSNRPGQVRPGSTGVAVPGYDLELRDETGAPITEAAVPGELYVRGPSIATGYWARYDATKQVFQGEWLRTGDSYVRNADGTYSCLGRFDDMLKAGGIWPSPVETSRVLRALRPSPAREQVRLRHRLARRPRHRPQRPRTRETGPARRDPARRPVGQRHDPLPRLGSLAVAASRMP